MHLQERDADILRALTFKVRLISQPQVAAAWWPDTSAGCGTARRRMGRLCAAGLIQQVRLRSQALPNMEAPVVAWSPGQREPTFGRVAWQLQSRWVGPTKQRAIYCATRKAINLFGGPLRSRLGQGTQATHDLGVTEIYLRLRRSNHPLSERWVGEDVLAPKHRGEKLPDAVLADARSVPERVLEFGGAYDARRVEAFHDDCANKNLPYELW